jgi:hypothetical protein
MHLWRAVLDQHIMALAQYLAALGDHASPDWETVFCEPLSGFFESREPAG